MNNYPAVKSETKNIKNIPAAALQSVPYSGKLRVPGKNPVHGVVV